MGVAWRRSAVARETADNMVKPFAEKTRSSAPGQSQKNREAGMQTDCAGAKTRLWSYSSQGRDGDVLLCLACMTTGLFKEHGIIVASRERLMLSPLIASHCSLREGWHLPSAKSTHGTEAESPLTQLLCRSIHYETLGYCSTTANSRFLSFYSYMHTHNTHYSPAASWAQVHIV